MIAFMLFSVFYLAFVGSQSDNVLDSEYMESELMLHSLCKNVLNDILIAPPTLTESLTLTAQKERFEDSDLQDFEYMVEWVQFELPNFFNLAGGGQDDEGNSGQNAQMQQYMNVMYESIKENVKQALWQVRGLRALEQKSLGQRPLTLMKSGKWSTPIALGPLGVGRI